MPRVNSSQLSLSEGPAPSEDDPVVNEYPDEGSGRVTDLVPDRNDVDDMGELYGVAETEGVPLQLGADLVTPRDRDRWENNPDSRYEPE